MTFRISLAGARLWIGSATNLGADINISTLAQQRRSVSEAVAVSF